MNLSEEPFFFDGAGVRLFGVWCAPDGPRRAALLYVHPFGEEKKSAHRVFVETARALAKEGVASLRFDLRGCGDSEGEFAQATFAKWLDDIAAAWNEMDRRAPRAPRGLLGLRMGAALAALACERLKRVDFLLLWQPILNGEEDFTRELRRLLVQQMFVLGKARDKSEDLVTALREGVIELDGYPVSADLYEDISNFTLKKCRLAFPKRSAVIQFGRPQRNIDRFIAVEALRGGVVDAPPVWRRIDFLPGPETGEHLAKEGLLNWI
jgi:exosortase A-associated hydrolase 2